MDGKILEQKLLQPQIAKPIIRKTQNLKVSPNQNRTITRKREKSSSSFRWQAAV